MSAENPFEGSVESSGEKRMMSWEELIQSVEQGRCNDTEMKALTMQAQMRLDDLNDTLENSPALTLTEVSFEVDFSKKQVLRAALNDAFRTKRDNQEI